MEARAGAFTIQDVSRASPAPAVSYSTGLENHTGLAVPASPCLTLTKVLRMINERTCKKKKKIGSHMITVVCTESTQVLIDGFIILAHMFLIVFELQCCR